jgi:integrase
VHRSLVQHGQLSALALFTTGGGLVLASVPRPPKPIHCLRYYPSRARNKRHTFGTVMARRVPLGLLQKLMGHADISTTMRYVDVSEDDKRDAIATVFGAFGQQVGNKAAGAGSTKAISVDEL